jgi:hypothetical protein
MLTDRQRTIAAEALQRAQSAIGPRKSDAQVLQHFCAAGIPLDDIVPRVNCLTYHAWLAKGRRVRKGAGAGACTLTVFIPTGASKRKPGESDSAYERRASKGGKRLHYTRVYHESQTDALADDARPFDAAAHTVTQGATL